MNFRIDSLLIPATKPKRADRRIKKLANVVKSATLKNEPKCCARYRNPIRKTKKKKKIKSENATEKINEARVVCLWFYLLMEIKKSWNIKVGFLWTGFKRFFTLFANRAKISKVVGVRSLGTDCISTLTCKMNQLMIFKRLCHTVTDVLNEGITGKNRIVRVNLSLFIQQCHFFELCLGVG